MSLNDLKLAPELSKKASGGPRFSTTITEQVSGKEQRNINWQNARSEYSISLKNLTNLEARRLLEFFYVCRGCGYSFKFRDWQDFEINNQIIGIGDNTKKDFQLIKEYSNQSVKYTKTITKPISSTLRVYADNVLVNSDQYSVNSNTGLISFVNAPSVPKIISASLQYDVPVRFKNDDININIESNIESSTKIIEFIEVL